MTKTASVQATLLSARVEQRARACGSRASWVRVGSIWHARRIARPRASARHGVRDSMRCSAPTYLALRAHARHGVPRNLARVHTPACTSWATIAAMADDAPFDLRLANYLAARGVHALALTVRGLDLANPADVRALRRSFGMPIPRPFRPRCGARTRSGAPCKAPCVWDADHDRPRTKRGRCKLHGGLSTGPRTEAGKARSRAALDQVNDARRRAQAESAAAA